MSRFKLLIVVFTLILGACSHEKRMRQLVEVPESLYSYTLTEKVELRSQAVNFDHRGATFDSLAEPSWLRIESLKGLKRQMNISFWFRLTSDVGGRTQTVLRAVDTQRPYKHLSIGFSGFRIGGSLNSHNFSAKDNTLGNEPSRTYFDLPRLEMGRYYFFSMNKEGGKIAIYVNAELYQEFDFKEDFELDTNQLLLGVLNTSGDFVNQYVGNLRNLDLFDQILTEDQIYSLSVNSYPNIAPFNDAYELSKFKLEN